MKKPYRLMVKHGKIMERIPLIAFQRQIMTIDEARKAARTMDLVRREKLLAICSQRESEARGIYVERREFAL